MNVKSYFNSGQIGIIAVLVGVVIFTLGMSTAARITTDIRVASRTEEGARAYAAAESATEIAMGQTNHALYTAYLTPAPVAWAGDGYVRGQYTVSGLPGRRPSPPAEYFFDIGRINEGEAKTVWLVYLAENASANVTPFSATGYPEKFLVFWEGISPDLSDLRVEVTLYYQSSLTNEVTVARRFETTSNSVEFDPTNASQLPSFVKYYLVRIKPIKKNIHAYVLPDPAGSANFPIQEFSITSDGWTDATEDQIRRRTVGHRLVGEIPLFFDYVLANGGGSLIKP